MITYYHPLLPFITNVQHYVGKQSNYSMKYQQCCCIFRNTLELQNPHGLTSQPTYLLTTGCWRCCSCISSINRSELSLETWCVLPSISKLILYHGRYPHQYSTLPTQCTSSVIINNDATNIYHKHHSYNAFAVLVNSKIYENT